MTTQFKVKLMGTNCTTELCKITEQKKNSGKLKFNLSKKNF